MAALKLEDLQDIEGLEDYKCFVETGTYVGETVKNIHSIFTEVHTVELNAFFLYQAKQLNAGNNVKIYFGDSVGFLEKLCPTLTENTIFYLDAHYSGGLTAKWIEDCPLLSELQQIKNNFNKKAVIIIDDVNLFGSKGNENWENITQESILAILGGCCKKYKITNNRMFIEFEPNE